MRSFPLDKGGPNRVEIRRGGAFQQVLLDGEVVLDFPDARSALRGMKTALPDGSELVVRSSFSWLAPGLLVARDGVPLPESDFDPKRMALRAARPVVVLGALFVVIGAASAIAHIHGETFAMIAKGALLLVMAWFVGRGQRLALACALAVLIIDTLIQLSPVFLAGATLRFPAGLLIRGLFAFSMVRGLVAMAATRRPRSS